MRRITPIKNSVFILVCIVILVFTSCQTTRVATKRAVVKPISATKLIKNIENNAFDYKHLSIKKISCQFDDGRTKTSFKASILAEKDKRIIVMLSKLNIPVGRVWLTPDSVKFINYLEQNYFLGDYSYLSSVLGMDLDFETIHAIISNNVFSLRDEKRDQDNHEYEVKIDSGLYVLESVQKLKTRKVSQQTGERKQLKKTKKILPDTPVRQSVFVDPETYKLRKLTLDDAANSRNLKIVFADFVAVEKQIYPGEIFLDFVSPESSVQLRVKLAGFSMDNDKEVRFKVPEKYTRINNN